MATPRDHIEEIRSKKFNIGGEPDPKNEDLHHAVKYLSAELYSKDVHFLMELIQNAEDNEYLEGVKPSLEFVITSQDITATGAAATLLVFNNEKGFSPKNIESICSVGRSTKKGFRKRGYIGEKGIGFKSVFLITAQPYIFSNGYQIRFNEEPCSECHVGYIVPEWVDDNPTLSTLKQIYGSDTSLPTTTIVLPLKPDKVKPVKQQLSSIHPEVLLFLSKIKKLSIKEDNVDTRLNSVTAISISTETDFVTRKNIDAESYMLHLLSDENDDNLEKECSYYMWKQRFPVRSENKVEKRMEVEEWVLTLAFPNGERLNRGMNSPGVYAFLPTEMVTNFPFIIQADFLLASSRETILMDNKWNQGILGCVPLAFTNAFISLVKTFEDAPISSLPPMFRFLPINESPYPVLNAVREKIQGKIMAENIVPCESYMEQKFFQKPGEVGRLMPAFWNILSNARKQGVNLHNISSHGRYVLSSSFDTAEYDHILNFLGVKPVEDEWYTNCIRGSNLVMGVSEKVYLELLLFLAENWRSNFQKTSIKNLPFLKYVSPHGDICLKSVHEVSQWTGGRVLISRESRHISWLIDWNREFRSATHHFLPKETQEALHLCSKRQTIQKWLLNEARIGDVNVYEYGILIYDSLDSDKKPVVAYVHFLYHSLSENYLSQEEVGYLCDGMPLVDNYGKVSTKRNGVLVPASGSKWISLIGSNPWIEEGYVELGEDYLRSGKFASVYTSEKQLIDFLKTHLLVCDVPDISPPNAGIRTMSAPLTKQNTFLLLDWIRSLNWKRVHLPEKFLTCIKEGRWMRVSLSGSHDYRPPSESFLTDSSWGHLLQHESVLVDIPIIDQNFYGNRLYDYKEEIRSIGVMLECGEACTFIGKRLMWLASSSTLTKGNVLSILKFIKFLQEKFLSPQDFIQSIREEKWLRTSLGDRSPVESVLFGQEWRAASQISDIPFIDVKYYGEEILSFKTELEMLGVVIGFGQNYQLVFETLKSPAHIGALTSESCLFVLECLRHLRSPDKFVRAFKGKKFLKTNMGYKSPDESYLFNLEWGCLLQVFPSFPLIDQNSYGSSILSYKTELKQLGVIVDFEEATKVFAAVFKQQAALSSIKKDSVLRFMACYKKLQGTTFKFPEDLKSCIRNVKWLRTRLGDYRVPKDCVLFGPDWESISPISRLPFIDDSGNYYGDGIHEYKKELKSMGVVLAFKDGYRFVADGLHLPRDPDNITPANVYSLLEYIRNFLEQKKPLPYSFLKKVSQKWLKTSSGYRSPDDCLLFHSDWNSFLYQEDGPFIDEGYYGSQIKSYSKELNLIGVTVEVGNGCSLLATHLESHSNFCTIIRIYKFLYEFNWESESESDHGDTRKIWIPNGSDDGEWVIAEECVLSDKNDLFGMQLNVLEKHYDKKLLHFFPKAFGVRHMPSVDDYCKLWKAWECSGRPLSNNECRAFWEYVVKHWNLETQKTLDKHLVKLPVYSGSDGILLFERRDVFIADDLQLKDLFKKCSSRPLFVWYPQPSVPSLPRGKLLEVYSKIGVRNISESVMKEEAHTSEAVCVREVVPRENLVGKGLVRLILGFLADLSLQMEAEKRHEAVRSLLDIIVLETVDPITIDYSLLLSSGEILKGAARRMIRWERESKKFFTQKMDRSDGHSSVIEYATRLSEAISEGLLWEKEDHMQQLAELIKLGFLVEFNDKAIEFLMKTKNLQLFLEDERFLSSAFLSD